MGTKEFTIKSDTFLYISIDQSNNFAVLGFHGSLRPDFKTQGLTNRRRVYH